MFQTLTVLLPPDVIEYVNTVAKHIGERDKTVITQSQAVARIIKAHRKKMLAKPLTGSRLP